jgi:hypothetical protein
MPSSEDTMNIDDQRDTILGLLASANTALNSPPDPDDHDPNRFIVERYRQLLTAQIRLCERLTDDYFSVVQDTKVG